VPEKTTHTGMTTVGIEISKAHLDVALHPGGTHRRFANTTAGWRQLIALLAPAGPERVVFEPTGACHRGLEAALGEAGLPLVKVNPRSARRFAEALGRPARTDRIDAGTLARMGAALELEVKAPPSRSLISLRELLQARRTLVASRTADANRNTAATHATLKRMARARLRLIERRIAGIDAAIRALIGKDPVLQRRFDVLVSIPGVGEVSAAMLVIEMPELGALNRREAAALAGLRHRRGTAARSRADDGSAVAGETSDAASPCPRSQPCATPPTSPRPARA
jgi:transposase